MNRCFSPLAARRHWAARIAPLRAAAEPLGPISVEIAQRTGLPPGCVVLCGMHDSNAALLAAKGHAASAGTDATVLSTGTWFVAMRLLPEGVVVGPAALDGSRDCLVNVDLAGRPVPSARFMGGREAELMGGVDRFAVGAEPDTEALIERLPALIAQDSMACPGFVPGVGPFPSSRGEWHMQPDDEQDLRAAAGLYLALMADAALDLIGSRERLLIEGRFAQDLVFVRALARLRPKQQVFVSNAQQDVAYGALRLVDRYLPPLCALTPVVPLELDLGEYAARWRSRAQPARSAA
jgi:sugar (pentulose or hexulose) kinase